MWFRKKTNEAEVIKKLQRDLSFANLLRKECLTKMNTEYFANLPRAMRIFDLERDNHEYESEISRLNKKLYETILNHSSKIADMKSKHIKEIGDLYESIEKRNGK